MQAERKRSEGYLVRLIEPDERDDYLDLYRTVMGDAGDAWFDWKYADNPYTDHLAIAVAVKDGQVVGAKSQVGCEVARGTDRYPALQPADTMVHPAHRRQGLYSRLTEHVKAVYADHEATLFFNYPNDATLSGSLKHGWTHVGPATTRYRVQNPAGFANRAGGRFGRTALCVGRGVVRAYDGLRRRGDRPDDLHVRQHESVPVEALADCYRRQPPDRLHVVRDETYLDWRFGNPQWDYTAYTVERSGEPVVGTVVGRRTVAGAPQVSLTEVVPPAPAGGDEEARAALLDAVLSGHPAADAIVAADDAFSNATFRRFGFLPDSAPPLSWVASPSNLVCYPLSDAFRDEREPDDVDDWVLGLGDRDTR